MVWRIAVIGLSQSLLVSMSGGAKSTISVTVGSMEPSRIEQEDEIDLLSRAVDVSIVFNLAARVSAGSTVSILCHPPLAKFLIDTRARSGSSIITDVLST